MGERGGGGLKARISLDLVLANQIVKSTYYFDKYFINFNF